MITNLAQLRQQAAVRFTSPEFQDGDPRKLRPLSLEQQKKLAKELLRAGRSGDSTALDRFRAAGLLSTEPIQLSDAQLLIARENGFKKWVAFKSYIDHATFQSQCMAAGDPVALDAGMHTLHIRCGHDIMHKLALAGFVGDYLAFPDPYVMGPVPRTETLNEFVSIRANYLSKWFDSPGAAQNALAAEYASLEQATSYERIMLWFEHDSYDQLSLAKLLEFFSKAADRPKEIKFISITGFPGIEIFNGLGQLPPEALRVLWSQFTVVTEEQFKLGEQVWDALTEPNPLALSSLVDSGTPAMPTMAPALQRHLRQLPSVANGLSLTEQLALQILNEKGSMNAGRLFGWYTNHYEPLAFLGDMQFYEILEALAGARHPALTITRTGKSPIDWNVALTDFGNDLLINKRDWISANNPDRWVGGMHIADGAQTWRIDSDLRPVFR